LESYYDVESRGPKKVTWGGICDHIFDLTGVQMDGESLRQFVRRIRRRNRPRVPSKENLEAISSFLCHPDIDMLSPEELEEPEIPFHSIRSLLEFLRHDQDSEISPPPPALADVYRAIHPSPETSTQINVELTFKVDGRDHVIRLSEVLELYTDAADVDSGTGLTDKPRIVQTRQQGEGWAVLTPEDNLLIFMKNKPFGHNYSYMTVALNTSIWTYPSVTQLALLRHEYPTRCDPIPTSLESLLKEANPDTLFLRFNKIEDTNKVVDADFVEVESQTQE